MSQNTWNTFAQFYDSNLNYSFDTEVFNSFNDLFINGDSNRKYNENYCRINKFKVALIIFTRLC